MQLQQIIEALLKEQCLILHHREMKCPQCHLTQTAKNRHRRGRQWYKCFSVWLPVPRILPPLALLE